MQALFIFVSVFILKCLALLPFLSYAFLFLVLRILALSKASVLATGMSLIRTIAEDEEVPLLDEEEEEEGEDEKTTKVLASIARHVLRIPISTF